ncbi:MAG TPA: hypothetical protein PKI11_14900 [Candidatus Hydrogenedentes bacterium]|nr:hypothetical protein [Candidatus Hydrogenedentota bacterium]
MITISLTQALLLYSALILLGAIAVWVYTEADMRRAHRVLGKQYLWRCFFCAYSYLDEEAETLSECPRCGSLNSREDAQVGFVPGRMREAATAVPAEPQPRRNPSQRRRPGARSRGPRKRRR